MKLRVGEPGSRFTPDFDASRSTEITLDDYIDELADLLAAGWSGFTGTVEQQAAATLKVSPPTIVQYDRWETIYAEAAAGLDVIDNVTDAVRWANDFIARAVAQGR